MSDGQDGFLSSLVLHCPLLTYTWSEISFCSNYLTKVSDCPNSVTVSSLSLLWDLVPMFVL